MEAPLFKNSEQPLVGLIMGSHSDWPTLQVAHALLQHFGVPHEARIVSAHRTPELMRTYAQQAEQRGLQVLIAGAGGAAHLPGMVAAFTTLPVLGVPMESACLKGLDSLYSIVQMPAGVPVATMAIGKAGASNAALMAIAILANQHPQLRQALIQWRTQQAQQALAHPLEGYNGL
jgi:5-(carboxyamino)imidazole ribonucleotide mutase